MDIPKKPAKKAAVKHTPQEEAAKDTWRAFEHLGRVEVLHASLDASSAKEIAGLTGLAQQALAAKNVKAAAELLRAAEHLSFGALASAGQAEKIDAGLMDAVKKEFNSKLKKADEHWAEATQHHASVEPVFHAAVERARKAFGDGSYRQALELARGAEALAHVSLQKGKELGAGSAQPKLTK